MFVLLQGDTTRRKNFVYHLELSISMTDKNPGAKQSKPLRELTIPAFTTFLQQCAKGMTITIKLLNKRANKIKDS